MNANRWLDSCAEQLEARETNEPVPLRKVTVRLGPSLIDKLDYIAEKTLKSRTSAAEGVIEMAINEVYEATLEHPFFSKMEISNRMGIDHDTLQELEELAADGELSEARLIHIVSNAKTVQGEGEGVAV